MGVYFPGQFLTTCSRCIANNDDWRCDATGELLDDSIAATSRMPDCPAINVPPHGRLIDADAQDAQIEALIERHLHGYTKSTWDFVCELRDILKRNRTVIPAEEGE